LEGVNYVKKDKSLYRRLPFYRRFVRGIKIDFLKVADDKNRGGKREGAGRPKLEDPRKLRGIRFNDAEWERITENARKCGVSVREYLWGIVIKQKKHIGEFEV
jgi:hypothetical protein